MLRISLILTAVLINVSFGHYIYSAKLWASNEQNAERKFTKFGDDCDTKNTHEYEVLDGGELSLVYANKYGCFDSNIQFDNNPEGIYNNNKAEGTKMNAKLLNNAINKVSNWTDEHKFILQSPPLAYYKDFDNDLTLDYKAEDIKRNDLADNNLREGYTVSGGGCNCKIRNDLLDLGSQHYPRYLLNAVCQNDLDVVMMPTTRCRPGLLCKPIEYKIKVLTLRTVKDHTQESSDTLGLPNHLAQMLKFKTITVTTACVCT